MATHIGIAQIDIILIDPYNPIKRLLEVGAIVPLRIAPLPIDNVALRYIGAHLHQLTLHNVLYLLYRNGSLLYARQYLASYLLYLTIIISIATSYVGLENSVFNLRGGKRLLHAIPLNDVKNWIIHITLTPES